MSVWSVHVAQRQPMRTQTSSSAASLLGQLTRGISQWDARTMPGHSSMWWGGKKRVLQTRLYVVIMSEGDQSSVRIGMSEAQAPSLMIITGAQMWAISQSTISLYVLKRKMKMKWCEESCRETYGVMTLSHRDYISSGKLLLHYTSPGPAGTFSRLYIAFTALVRRLRLYIWVQITLQLVALLLMYMFMVHQLLT